MSRRGETEDARPPVADVGRPLGRGRGAAAAPSSWGPRRPPAGRRSPVVGGRSDAPLALATGGRPPPCDLSRRGLPRQGGDARPQRRAGRPSGHGGPGGDGRRRLPATKAAGAVPRSRRFERATRPSSSLPPAPPCGRGGRRDLSASRPARNDLPVARDQATSRRGRRLHDRQPPGGAVARGGRVRADLLGLSLVRAASGVSAEGGLSSREACLLAGKGGQCDVV